LDPTYAAPHANLGTVYRALGRQEEAIATYQRAIELDPTDARFHNNLGLVYSALGRQEDAIAAYQRAIELDPNDAVSQASFAAACRELGREQEYEEHIQRARGLMANESDYNKACIESIAGNVEAALEHLAKALEKHPGQRAWARRDPDLAFIRDDPRFRELVGEDDRG
jgi:tetratricopeptide (TPR) repeat protein